MAIELGRRVSLRRGGHAGTVLGWNASRDDYEVLFDAGIKASFRESALELLDDGTTPPFFDVGAGPLPPGSYSNVAPVAVDGGGEWFIKAPDRGEPPIKPFATLAADEEARMQIDALAEQLRREDRAACRASMDIARALVEWGRTIRRRYTCGRQVEHCGGSCNLERGHSPPCLCEGDMSGPGTCEA